MSDAPKPWWASLLEAAGKLVQQIVGPVLAFFAGRQTKELEQTKKALKDAEHQVELGQTVSTRRDDDAERSRVRDRFRDPSEKDS